MAGEAPQTPVDIKTARRASVSKEVAEKVENAQPSSTESNHRRDLANTYRTAVEKSENPSRATTLREMIAETEVPDVQRSKGSIEGNIFHSGVDGARNASENDRFTRATAAESAIRHILEKKTLVGDPNTETIVKSLDQITDTISDVPLSDSQKREVVEALIKDPDILNAIRIKFGERATKVLADDVTTAQKLAADAKSKYDQVDGSLTEVKENLERTRAEQDDPQIKAELQKLESLNLDTELRIVQEKLRDAKDRLAKINTGKYDGDPTTENQAIDSYERAIDSNNQQIAERNRLKALPQEIKRLQREQEQFNNSASEAGGVKNAADTALTDAKGNRSDAENEFVRSLENVVRDATVDVIDARVEKVNAAARERLAKEEADATEHINKKMAEIAANRYYTTLVEENREAALFWRKTPGEEKIITNRDKAIDDMDNIIKLNRGGTPGLVREVLLETYPDVYNPSQPGEKIHDPRVDQLMNDQAFVDKWGVELGRGAIDAYLQTGGKISKMQGEYIEAQSWGKGLIEKAVETAEVVQVEKMLQEKGKLPAGGFRELMKTKKGKTIIGLLLGISAGVILPAAVPALLASKMER